MNLFKLTAQEIRCRPGNFLLGVLSVLVATAVLSGAFLLISDYDRETEAVLSAKEQQLHAYIQQLQSDTVRAMKHLGFNITILPAGQNLSDWYSESYASVTMPQTDMDRLQSTGLLTLENLEPVLRRKTRWPETRWTVLICGTGAPSAPPPGMVDIGDEIARGLSLRAGDTLTLMKQPFTVRQVLAQQAGVDDITLTLALKEAQQLLNESGRISEIRAVQRRAAWQDIARIREEVSRLIPGAQVIENGSEVLAKVTAIRQVEEKGQAQIEGERAARERMRQSLRRTMGVLLPLVLFACVAWIYLLAADNTSQRLNEIGMLRSLGFSSRAVLAVFMTRVIAAGLLGGVCGLLLSGVILRSVFSVPVLLMLPAALLIALAGGAVPLIRAVRADPADILRGDS